MSKRSIKPKTIFSPSNPAEASTYHLIIYSDTNAMTIVGHSSVKRLESNGLMMLNNGRQGQLVVSGPKTTCIEQWNRKINCTADDTDDELDDDVDEIPDLIDQTVQAPTAMFSTPAPYRRERPLTNRALSPDSIICASPSKRFAGPNHSNRPTKHRADARPPSRKATSATTNQPLSSSSSEDEAAMMETDGQVSLNRIFRELKNTQVNLQENRTENQGIHQQVTKLTQKIAQFKALFAAKGDHDLDRYRDTNDKEVYKEEILYDDRNLLAIPARNTGEYARKLLRILFKPHELQSSLLPSRQSNRYFKPELDQERLDLLNEAVRVRYRIAKYSYDSFYKERLQSTLAACVYNSGRRKLKQQENQETTQITEQQTTAMDRQQTPPIARE